MAQKIYKSAMGRVVDIGALMLENENVRAVGNMNVNARGDTLDSANRVIESKPKQVQKPQHQLSHLQLLQLILKLQLKLQLILKLRLKLLQILRLRLKLRLKLRQFQ